MAFQSLLLLRLCFANFSNLANFIAEMAIRLKAALIVWYHESLLVLIPYALTEVVPIHTIYFMRILLLLSFSSWNKILAIEKLHFKMKCLVKWMMMHLFNALLGSNNGKHIA